MILRYSYINIVLLLATIMSFAGCGSKPKATPAPPPPPPEPVVLEKLPNYGMEKSGYATSAVIVSSQSSRDSVSEAIMTELVDALLARGYYAESFYAGKADVLSMAEVRQQCQKLIFVNSHEVRSAYLPVKRMNAYDIVFSVSVADMPAGFVSNELPTRDFVVYGRDIIDSTERTDLRLTTTGAVKSAVKNLFCIEPFREALEPKQ